MFSGIRSAAVVVAMVSSSALGAQRPGEQVGHAADHPDSARFITDDLRNFTRVLAVLRQGYETDTVAVMTREYFGRATPAGGR